jgi:hypothetical protein
MDELRQACEQIMYLTSNFNKQSNGNDPTNSNNQSPSIDSPKPQNSPDVSQAPLHSSSKLAAIKQSLVIHNQKNRHRKEKTASRFFQPPSPNQGYKYLYFHTNFHIPVGRLRS